VDDPDTKPIGVNLPKTKKPFYFTDDKMIKQYDGKRVHAHKSLLPFFDNLVSEGWLGMAQRKAHYDLVERADPVNRIEEFEAQDSGDERYRRLLMFGRGFHGNIAIVDAAVPDELLEWEERLARDNLESRATLTGAQAKILGVKRADNLIEAAERDETSTHIVKIAQKEYPRIIQNEFLNVMATKALLHDDTTMHVEIAKMADGRDALAIERFDRTANGGRIPFEEALQIANKPCDERYESGYEDLGQITRELCGEKEVERLFKRLVAQLLLGNTDSHMKNFAFWQKNGKWELTPNYDLVSTVNYKRSAMALSLQGNHLPFVNIDSKRIFMLGKAMGLKIETIKTLADGVCARIPDAIAAINAIDQTTISTTDKKEFCAHLTGRAERQYGSFGRYYVVELERAGRTTERR
jgi:serine/threonine-protein kinase HipA